MVNEQQGPLSVSEAARRAKECFERIRLTIEGEISELTDRRGYKSVFFTIKDEHATLYCKMWRSVYDKAGIQLEVGSLVRITGRFTIWAEKGDIKFEASSIDLAGEGMLRQKVAQLERTLRAEGLFEPSRKRPLPAFPERIGLVTSPRGAVVHDVLRTLRRRYPLATVYFAGVPVEGKGAPEAITNGLREVYRNKVEVILLVIGGGSFEHLMAFNDEGLVRAMSKCPTPIITGIGHEHDNFLADLVADVRCTSPTAAAEAVAPSTEMIGDYLQSYLDRMNRVIDLRMQHARLRLEKFESRPIFCDRYQLLADRSLRVDYLAQQLSKAIPQRIAGIRDRVATQEERLKRAIPGALAADSARLDLLQSSLSSQVPRLLSLEKRGLDASGERLKSTGKNLLAPYANGLGLAAARLNDLSPLEVMARGYSIGRTPEGKVVSSVAQISQGDELDIQMRDGLARCRVEDIERAQVDYLDMNNEEHGSGE